MYAYIAQDGIFAALLFIASIADIRKRIIPDTVSLLITCSGLFLFEPERVFGILIALPFLIAALLSKGMGGGDVKLAAASGFVLGFNKGIAAVIIGLSAMLFFYGVYFFVQKLRGGKCQKSLPLAPFLSLGCIAAYFMNFGGIVL